MALLDRLKRSLSSKRNSSFSSHNAFAEMGLDRFGALSAAAEDSDWVPVIISRKNQTSTTMYSQSAMDRSSKQRIDDIAKLSKLSSLQYLELSSSSPDGSCSDQSPSPTGSSNSRESFSSKHRRRFKCKAFLEHLRRKDHSLSPQGSRVSSPRGISSQRKSDEFVDASIIEDVSKNTVVMLTSNSEAVPNVSSQEASARVSVATCDQEKPDNSKLSQDQEKISRNRVRIEAKWAAIGLIIIILGLFLGRIVSMVCLVCWWYVVPMISHGIFYKYSCK